MRGLSPLRVSLIWAVLVTVTLAGTGRAERIGPESPYRPALGCLQRHADDIRVIANATGQVAEVESALARVAEAGGLALPSLQAAGQSAEAMEGLPLVGETAASFHEMVRAVATGLDAARTLHAVDQDLVRPLTRAVEASDRALVSQRSEDMEEVRAAYREAVPVLNGLSGQQGRAGRLMERARRAAAGLAGITRGLPGVPSGLSNSAAGLARLLEQLASAQGALAEATATASEAMGDVLAALPPRGGVAPTREAEQRAASATHAAATRVPEPADDRSKMARRPTDVPDAAPVGRAISQSPRPPARPAEPPQAAPTVVPVVPDRAVAVLSTDTMGDRSPLAGDPGPEGQRAAPRQGRALIAGGLLFLAIGAGAVAWGVVRIAMRPKPSESA